MQRHGKPVSGEKNIGPIIMHHVRHLKSPALTSIFSYSHYKKSQKRENYSWTESLKGMSDGVWNHFPCMMM